jgi:hypothetical protein
MTIRNVAVACAIFALAAILPSIGRTADRPADNTLANNFVNLKAGFPVVGLEVEHVFSNGIAVSVAGSYVRLSQTDRTVKYATLGSGIKKYIGDHRTFYVAGYPQLVVLDLSEKIVGCGPLVDRGDYFAADRVDYVQEGSLSVLTLLGAIGWRGVLDHFTVGGELGGGYTGLKGITTSGTNPETGVVTTGGYGSASLDGVGPMAQIYVGYAF